MSDWTCQKTQQAGRATLQKDFFTDDRVVKVKFNACKMCVYWQLWDALGSKLCLHTVAYISAIKCPAEWQWRWAANSDRGDSGEKSSTNWTRNQSGVCLNPLLLTFLPVFLLHFWTIICSKHVFFLMGPALGTAPPFCCRVEKQAERRKTTLIGSPVQPAKNSTIKKK